MRRLALAVLAALWLACPGRAAVRLIDVAPVWPGHPAAFCLLTRAPDQFVAFYDAERRLTLAQRRLGSDAWKFKVLPSVLGWDSHNYVTLALDRQNCLHVSGNMHVAPLVYFRGERPLDIDSVAPVARLTGQPEDRVTYPRFLKGPQGELVFLYREGRSGNGETRGDVYDEASRTWRPLWPTPLFDGEGKRNAYPLFAGPDADGYYTASWTWRDTPDAATCHDLGFLRSRDLVRWTTLDGQPVALPVRLGTPGVIVDPVPAGGGLLNGMGRVGYGTHGETLLSYAKYDAAGKTQLYLAWWRGGKWRIEQASRWDARIEFSGRGTLPDPGIRIGPVETRGGKMTVSITLQGRGQTWEIDPATWRLAGPALRAGDIPAALRRPRSAFPGMAVRWAFDEDGDPAYRLRWETLPANRDLPRPAPWPEPSLLQVVEIEKKGS